MIAPDAFTNPFRPIHEYTAVAAWTVSAVVAIPAMLSTPHTSVPFLAFAGISTAMALWRGTQAMALVQRQRRLKGHPLEFITLEEVREIVEANPGKLFLGWGFDWGQRERQLAHTIIRSDPARLIPQEEEGMGQRWIHGLGEYEEPIFLPLDDTFGHMFLPGTTRAGKSQEMILLIVQAIFRGEAVIVLDPKNDPKIVEVIRAALTLKYGNDDRLTYLSPAYPERSSRIDPLRNFNRATELASRIATLIPSETGSDPFTAFGLMALNNVIEGLLLIDQKPTLVKLRRYLEGGIASLVIQATEAYCLRVFPDNHWREQLKRLTENKKQEKDIATANVQFYYEYIIKRAPSSELEGLLSSFTHNAEHARKMLASLLPVLVMLTSGHIGKLLSPDPNDLGDHRPITDLGHIIKNGGVAVFGLDALTDRYVASCVGTMFISDLTAVAGDRYNYGKNLNPFSVFIDEASQLISDAAIVLLNQSGGAKARLCLCSQSIADWEAKMGSAAKARMALANLNNVVSMRVIEPQAQEFVVETMLQTQVHHIEYAQQSRVATDNPLSFAGSTSESLKETEVDLVPAALLGCLPNLEYFARISGGKIKKGRGAILQLAA